jgi:hypothetical protein
MNILLTLFLLFLVIVLLFSNLKYRNKFRNYDRLPDNNKNVIVNNYISQILKYVFEIKSRNDNMPVKFTYI